MELEKAVENVHFGMVLTALKNGDLVGRKDFKDGKLLYLVNGSQFTVNRPPLSKIMPMGTSINYQPHIDYMVDGNICGVYNLLNEDVLATDWFIVRYQSFLDKLERKMKVTQIVVTLERTFQLAPFNGVRISFSEQIEIGPDDDPEKVRRVRLRSLKRQIASEVEKAMEEAK